MIAIRSRKPRRGSLLLETAVSALLLMVAMGLVTSVLASLAAERRAWDRRQSAAFEAAAVMERIAAFPFDDLTPAGVEGLSLSTEAVRALPSGDLDVEVAEEDAGDGLESRRVHVVVRWRNRAGDWDAPVRLTSWVHRRKEQP